ncbi:vanadium-dependent haloperoxidase [uncultured Arcticibacterium sp.]|uniref:vanadium-dependent haloperoxidase n=1 Tax=uncultured Arcticibacterium sp. TaxID=2173042 RepID=UPI0030F55F67
MLKKSAFLLLLSGISHFSFGQQITSQNYQARDESNLVEFEFVLPEKQYDFKTSDLLVKWHVLLFDLLEQTNGYTPNVAARSLAYINLASYEAMLPGHSEYRSMSGQIQEYERHEDYDIGSEQFSSAVAINNAVYYMVDELFTPAPYVWMEKVWAFKDSVNMVLAKDLDEETFQKSRNYGLAVGKMIYAYSKSDGGHQAYLRSYDMNYLLPECESCFEIHRSADLENTGPLHPGWQYNRTFMIENDTDFGIKPKVTFSKYPKSPFYKMAYDVYEESKTVNPGNKKYVIANFWDDAAGFTYTAPGHSAAILTMVLRKEPVSIEKASELYCRLGLALNDAIICSWKGKMKHNLIRPVAYINRYIDSAWEPKLLTPPFPEFPSGHSVQSAAMAEVLTQTIGSDIAFTDYSKFWVGEPRKFKSFWDAADETSVSRFYGGIHYMDALDQGQDMGKLVGQNILKLKFLKD